MIMTGSSDEIVVTMPRQKQCISVEVFELDVTRVYAELNVTFIVVAVVFIASKDFVFRTY